MHHINNKQINNIMETTNSKAIDKVIMYSFNYEYNFITKAFKNDSNLANHLQAKFTNYYNKFGNGETAFLWLYTSLSGNNKQILVNYILNK